MMNSSTECPSSYLQQHVYVPPTWAKDILHQPSTYVQMSILPTPIHSWKLPGVPEGFQISIKRDDMTGSTLSGNKIRKLEFLLADALQKGCDSIITCGGIQSNHARTTALAARQLGLQPHLVLLQHGEVDVNMVGCHGNILLNRAVGSMILLVATLSCEGKTIIDLLRDRMEDYKQKLEDAGSIPYLISVGGSTTVGTWGYIEAFRELMDQGLHDQFDDVVVATGSGGTLCGLAIANYLTGSKLKIHGVCVSNDASYFHTYVDQQLEIFGLATNLEGKSLHSCDIVDVIDGYKGQGYGLSSDEELGQLCDIMCATGVILDPVYTLKGVRGMLCEMQVNPARFLGTRVLYIHTGGVFGLFDGKLDDLLQNSASTNQVFDYRDIIPD